MQFPLRAYPTLAAALLLPNAAYAAATYAWVPDDPNGCCRGVLELSDDAFASGRASWTPSFPAEGNPVERFHFDGRFKVTDLQPKAAVTKDAEKDVELVVRFASTPDAAPCCAWDFQLKVDGAGLSGRLRVTTQNDDIILVGTEKSWQIERAGSDALSSGVICGPDGTTACSSGRGRWVLISAPGREQRASNHGSESATEAASLHLR